MKDLEGIIVVAIEQAVAAPYASGRLADAGARVIKVERPEGDFARGYDSLAKGNSAYFVWLNRGKESIALDLKTPQDLDILKNIVAKADIVIQNLAPGALERLGLGLEDMRLANPALVTCSISGYGEEGPRRDQKAYDLLIQAESGLCAINGTPEGPARVGVSVCDIAAGMAAHAAILQALFARSRTGQGRAIAVSLFHSLADWMNVPMMQHRYGGKTPGRLGLKHPTIAPYGVFECGDSKPLLISIQNEQEWQRLCTVLNDENLPSEVGFRNNSERVENRHAVDGFVASGFAQLDRESMIELLQKAKIAFGRLSDLDDFVAHPQNNWVTVEAAGEEIEILSPAAIVDGVRSRFGAVPKLDQHGAALREEFD
ncbi:MAG: CoA transferase [Rhizobiaceae bacterium]|nr:CoA transferase [Rhizobiaceae bacterium]